MSIVFVFTNKHFVILLYFTSIWFLWLFFTVHGFLYNLCHEEHLEPKPTDRTTVIVSQCIWTLLWNYSMLFWQRQCWCIWFWSNVRFLPSKPVTGSASSSFFGLKWSNSKNSNCFLWRFWRKVINMNFIPDHSLVPVWLNPGLQTVCPVCWSYRSVSCQRLQKRKICWFRVTGSIWLLFLEETRAFKLPSHAPIFLSSLRHQVLCFKEWLSRKCQNIHPFFYLKSRGVYSCQGDHSI